jgi:hypothetical protein
MIRTLIAVGVISFTSVSAHAGNLTEDNFKGCIAEQFSQSVLSTHKVNSSLIATLSGVHCLDEWHDMTVTFGTPYANAVFESVIKRKTAEFKRGGLAAMRKRDTFASHGDE